MVYGFRFTQGQPLISEDLPGRVLGGYIELKAGIKEITGKSLYNCCILTSEGLLLGSTAVENINEEENPSEMVHLHWK